MLLEEARKSKKSKKDKTSDKPDTFTEKLVTNLLKNMEVKIRDIHVRYEDATRASRHGSTLAAGVTLHSLELKVRVYNMVQRVRERGLVWLCVAQRGKLLVWYGCVVCGKMGKLACCCV